VGENTELYLWRFTLNNARKSSLRLKSRNPRISNDDFLQNQTSILRKLEVVDLMRKLSTTLLLKTTMKMH